jgi:hypothetical protein
MAEDPHSVKDARPDERHLGNASPLRNPGDVTSQRSRERPHGVTPGSLGAIVGNLKSVTTRRVNRIRHTPGARVWQRNYYERIVRDAQALRRIRQYIHDNPARWREDIENLAARAAPTLKKTAAY